MVRTNLIFEPLNRFTSHGDEIQVCKTTYKGIEIINRTLFPYNFMKDITDSYLPDYVLPMDTKLPNDGIMSDAFYTEEGFGVPIFYKLEHCLKFIDNFKK